MSILESLAKYLWHTGMTEGVRVSRLQHWTMEVKLPGSSRLVKEDREERSARSGSSGPLGGSEADTWLLQLFSSRACRAELSSPGDGFSEDLSARDRGLFY